MGLVLGRGWRGDADCGDSVYCSAATKELLIRLERSTNRINFENGVLEVRRQDYKALEPRLVCL